MGGYHNFKIHVHVALSGGCHRIQTQTHQCNGQFLAANHSPGNRRPKLTMRGVIIFLNLYANVPRVKRDTVTADIYYYVTTEFDYMKCDLRLAAYDGVV